MFRASRDIRNETCSTSESNTHNLKGVLFFMADYLRILLFLPVATFFIIFLFFLVSLHLHILTRHISSNFLPCSLSVSSKLHHLVLNRLLILGQEWANSGPRAKFGPPQRFQWPAEAFTKIFKSKISSNPTQQTLVLRLT